MLMLIYTCISLPLISPQQHQSTMASPPKSLLLLLLLTLSLSLLQHVANADHSTAPPPKSPKPDHKAGKDAKHPDHKTSVEHPDHKTGGGSSALDVQALKPICDKTTNPDVCMSSIQSVAAEKKVGATNATTVLKLAIKAAIGTTKAAVKKVKALAKDPKYDDSKDMKKLLRGCATNFKAALSDLEDARDELGNDNAKAKTHAISGRDLFIECKGSFDVHADEMPMLEDQVMLRKLAENVVSIFDIALPKAPGA